MRQVTLVRDQKISQVGRDVRRELVDPSVGAHLFDIAEGPFVDDPSDLQVPFGRRIHDEQVPAADVAARGAAVEKVTGDVPPHDVEAWPEGILAIRGAFANPVWAPAHA